MDVFPHLSAQYPRARTSGPLHFEKSLAAFAHRLAFSLVHEEAGPDDRLGVELPGLHFAHVLVAEGVPLDICLPRLFLFFICHLMPLFDISRYGRFFILGVVIRVWTPEGIVLMSDNDNCLYLLQVYL